ncbi:MAG: hypothetical protein HRU20_14595 [Pseudomonadales bacterium]|nr:hypothetical protein [Pseudomonadales bacterium]
MMDSRLNGIQPVNQTRQAAKQGIAAYTPTNNNKVSGTIHTAAAQDLVESQKREAYIMQGNGRIAPTNSSGKSLPELDAAISEVEVFPKATHTMSATEMFGRDLERKMPNNFMNDVTDADMNGSRHFKAKEIYNGVASICGMDGVFSAGKMMAYSKFFAHMADECKRNAMAIAERKQAYNKFIQYETVIKPLKADLNAQQSWQENLNDHDWELIESVEAEAKRQERLDELLAGDTAKDTEITKLTTSIEQIMSVLTPTQLKKLEASE